MKGSKSVLLRTFQLVLRSAGLEEAEVADDVLQRDLEGRDVGRAPGQNGLDRLCGGKNRSCIMHITKGPLPSSCLTVDLSVAYELRLVRLFGRCSGARLGGGGVGALDDDGGGGPVVRGAGGPAGRVPVPVASVGVAVGDVLAAHAVVLPRAEAPCVVIMTAALKFNFYCRDIVLRCTELSKSSMNCIRTLEYVVVFRGAKRGVLRQNWMH